MVYHYQGTIITVKPGIGGDNWATCKRKPNGSWTSVRSPEMPRTDRSDEAINNLHSWAEKKGLRRADCGCCYFGIGEQCQKYNKELDSTEVIIFGRVNLRCEGCDEFEKHSKGTCTSLERGR